MPDFPIIDSHVHLYDPALLSYPWLRGNAVLDQPSLMRRFDAERGGVEVEALVFVEVAVERGQHIEEAARIEALAAVDPRIAAIVAHAPVDKGEGVGADLDALAANSRLRGVRRLIQGEVDPGICLAPDFIAGVRQVGERGLVFDLCVKHWAMVFVIELVRRCPEVTFVLDHIGKPGIALGLREPWWSQIAELAALPNVVCKLSGVITEADHGAWGEADLAPYIARTLDCFGCERVMFGSDWPVSELTHRYADWVAIVDRALEPYGEAGRRAVFRETAIRSYSLGQT
jgi:L-fuconolactonase